MHTRSRTVLRAAIGAVVVALFILALHTVRYPEGEWFVVLKGKTFLHVVQGVLVYLLAVLATGFFLRWRLGSGFALSCRYVMSPVLLLLVYPAAVFVLQPLRCPQALVAWLEPGLILLLAVSLAAFRLMEVAWRPWRGWRGATPGKIAGMLFVAFALFYVAATLVDDRKTSYVGDEPQYLMLMQNIRQYHAVEISQLYLEGSSDPEIHLMFPHGTGTSRPGTHYNIHNVGLPLLMLLPYIVGGYTGIIIMLNLVAALSVANVFLLCHEFTRRKGLSLVTAVLTGLSCPLVFYFRCIYPDVIASLLLIYAFRIVRDAGRSIPAMFAGGVAAAYLPWLHVKFVILSATLAAYALLLPRDRRRQAAAYIAPVIVSGVWMAAFFEHAFGNWMPNAPFGAGPQLVSHFFFRGALGQLFDRNHGLLAYAPCYLFVAPGLVMAWRAFRKETLRIAILLVPYYITSSSLWIWWAGPCPPGRYIMPALVLAAPFLCMGIHYALRSILRPCLVFTVAITLVLTWISFHYVAYLPRHRHFMNEVAPSWAAFSFFPNFSLPAKTPVPFYSAVGGVVWLVLGALMMGQAVRDGSRPRSAGGPSPRSVFAVALSAAIVLGWPGLCGVASTLADGEPLSYREQTVWRPEQFSYYMSQFMQPLERAGILQPLSRWEHRQECLLRTSHPLDADCTVTEAQLRDANPLFLVRKQILTLYPIPYRVTCELHIDADALERSVGYAELITIGGRAVASSPLLPGMRRVEIDCLPGCAVPAAAVRVAVTRPATVETYRVDIDAYLPVF